MSLINVGRVCYKIAGREAGKLCVVVDTKNKNFVLIDGNVRRKLCNLSHLEPTNILLKIKKGISTSDLHEAMKKEKLNVEVRKKKEKKVKVEKEVKEEKPKKEVKVKKEKTKKKAK
ncbi:MAG: 50S ribosomal protein L14e [Nanoarchaeota archaeon]|nr:50S ribosomal protein L14e [Nanoarchaeota archaeon]